MKKTRKDLQSQSVNMGSQAGALYDRPDLVDFEAMTEAKHELNDTTLRLKQI